MQLWTLFKSSLGWTEGLLFLKGVFRTIGATYFLALEVKQFLQTIAEAVDFGLDLYY